MMRLDVRRVLVTGAEEHQGLAVVRGLGLAGIEVIACGAHPRSLAFHSRYATRCRIYTPPAHDPHRFVQDILAIAHETRPALIMPAVESTLVALNLERERVEMFARLAAPQPPVLEVALDKARTVALAERLGVPVPATVAGESIKALLGRASLLRFPVVVKPRGNALHTSTAHALPFKSRYAASPAELFRILAPHAADAAALLVQEYAPGTGRCVAAVCRDGEPLAMFAYARDREFPLSGGVSVMRRSIPLPAAARDHAGRLLRAIGWQGVAMVEFKYDADADTYTLMEINGRFQASTALCVDAGLNLPLLAACVFTGWTPPATTSYHLGVEERWLRGDVLALRDALRPARNHAGRTVMAAPPGPRPRPRDVIARFLADFRRGVRYDEFHPDDIRPAVAEALAILRVLATWMRDALRDRVVTAVRAVAAVPHRVGAPAAPPAAVPRP